MTYRTQSPLLQVLGGLVGVVALVGTQLLGWEWGGGQLLPTLLGVAVAAVALTLTVTRWTAS